MSGDSFSDQTNQRLAAVPRLLDAIQICLTESNAPMGSRELAHQLTAAGFFGNNSLTPHQTINARIAEDIRENGPRSVFMRSGSGQYALRKWGLPEAFVKPRKINPIDEFVLAIERNEFLRLFGPDKGLVSNVNYRQLLDAASPVYRADAEETDDFVQLISSVVVIQNNSYLTYERTKKLPESRLHNTRSLTFGGHIQADDYAPLFGQDRNVQQLLILRELYEELNVIQRVEKVEYRGCIYLSNSMFERQHCGILFFCDIDGEHNIKSTEPGYHQNLKYFDRSSLISSDLFTDSWTQIIISSAI